MRKYIDIYTKSYEKHRGSSLALCDDLEGWDGGRRLKTEGIFL